MPDLDKEISSVRNLKVKGAVKLRQRRDRDRSKLFLVEGYRELLRACDNNVKFETMFYCRDCFLGENEDALIDRIKKSGAEVFSCTKQVFDKLSYRDRPDGLLAIAPHLSYSLDDLSGDFLVIAESVEKPGNLGTILRSADAVSADAVIVCDRCTDIHNPNVVRASTGTVFTRPVIETEGEKLLNYLRERKFSIVAATPSAKLEYTQADFKGPVAIVLGTEQYGLSERWMEGANVQVRIPMLGCADSLNVAMATTILLYEVLRQRSL